MEDGGKQKHNEVCAYNYLMHKPIRMALCNSEYHAGEV